MLNVFDDKCSVGCGVFDIVYFLWSNFINVLYFVNLVIIFVGCWYNMFVR